MYVMRTTATVTELPSQGGGVVDDNGKICDECGDGKRHKPRVGVDQSDVESKTHQLLLSKWEANYRHVDEKTSVVRCHWLDAEQHSVVATTRS